jgi:origin recognition complex subunit 1
VKHRIESASKDVVMPDFITADAIKFASKKVASISGDARRVLDICR